MTSCRTRLQPSAARPVSRAHDAHEREATRAAGVVARGGSVASWSFAAVPAEAPVQRQETDKPKTEDEKYKEAAEQAGKAALKTPQGAALKKVATAAPGDICALGKVEAQ